MTFNVSDVLDERPEGATHYDTGEGCYLKAVNDTLYYMFPKIHKSWHTSNHRDGVDALHLHKYHVQISEIEKRYWFVLGMDSFLNTCGNSYVNAFMGKYLCYAEKYVGYDGPVTGKINEVLQEVYDFQERWLERNAGTHLYQ